MNQQQIRYTKARIEAIRDSKIKKLLLEKPSNNYTGVNEILEKEIRAGFFTVKTKNEIIKLVNDGDSVETNLRHALIFKRFPNGRADVEAMLAEQSEAWKQRVKLVEDRADQIIDEMILGDCDAALEALRSFESQEF